MTPINFFNKMFVFPSIGFFIYLTSIFFLMKVTIVAMKIFEDFDTFRTAIPLKERFFQLKPNVLGM